MNELELTGRARTHIIDLEQPRCALHFGVVASWLAMRDEAARAGIDLVPVSSFRDFDRQVMLWNRKWRGERPLYDRSGRLLDYALLTSPRASMRSCAGRRCPAAAGITGAPIST